MAQEQTAIRERQKTRLKEPGRYVVMMFNDDFTPMDLFLSRKPLWEPIAMTSPRARWRKRWSKLAPKNIR